MDTRWSLRQLEALLWLAVGTGVWEGPLPGFPSRALFVCFGLEGLGPHRALLSGAVPLRQGWERPEVGSCHPGELKAAPALQNSSVKWGLMSSLRYCCECIL